MHRTAHDQTELAVCRDCIPAESSLFAAESFTWWLEGLWKVQITLTTSVYNFYNLPGFIFSSWVWRPKCYSLTIAGPDVAVHLRFGGYWKTNPRGWRMHAKNAVTSWFWKKNKCSCCSFSNFTSRSFTDAVLRGNHLISGVASSPRKLRSQEPLAKFSDFALYDFPLPFHLSFKKQWVES